MPTATQNDLTLTSSDWVDVTATITGAVNAPCAIQNVSGDSSTVDVVFGGGSAPTGKTGLRLWYGDSVTGNAAKVWARSNDGSAVISVTLL